MSANGPKQTTAEWFARERVEPRGCAKHYPGATLWRLFMLRTGELIAVREVRLIAKKALVVLVIAIGFPEVSC